MYRVVWELFHDLLNRLLVSKDKIMHNDKTSIENDDVCVAILDKFGKPNNFYQCKAINVYDDRYRVNIYCTREVDGIEGKCIGSSYFVKYNNGDLNILRT